MAASSNACKQLAGRGNNCHKSLASMVSMTSSAALPRKSSTLTYVRPCLVLQCTWTSATNLQIYLQQQAPVDIVNGRRRRTFWHCCRRRLRRMSRPSTRRRSCLWWHPHASPLLRAPSRLTEPIFLAAPLATRSLMRLLIVAILHVGWGGLTLSKRVLLVEGRQDRSKTCLRPHPDMTTAEGI